MDGLIHGIIEQQYLDNPFQRFNESLEKYPNFLEDMDDIHLVQYDNFERLKRMAPKEGTTAGETTVIPPEDND